MPKAKGKGMPDDALVSVIDNEAKYMLYSERLGTYITKRTEPKKNSLTMDVVDGFWARVGGFQYQGSSRDVLQLKKTKDGKRNTVSITNLNDIEFNEIDWDIGSSSSSELVEEEDQLAYSDDSENDDLVNTSDERGESDEGSQSLSSEESDASDDDDSNYEVPDPVKFVKDNVGVTGTYATEKWTLHFEIRQGKNSEPGIALVKVVIK